VTGVENLPGRIHRWHSSALVPITSLPCYSNCSSLEMPLDGLGSIAPLLLTGFLDDLRKVDATRQRQVTATEPVGLLRRQREREHNLSAVRSGDEVEVLHHLDAIHLA